MSSIDNGDLESLNIASERCPMSFIRVKLRLEAMKVGEILKVSGIRASVMSDLPFSLQVLGHSIIHQEVEIDESDEDQEDKYCLVIKKGA
jgi:TusA-related sulfurtransferase